MNAPYIAPKNHFCKHGQSTVVGRRGGITNRLIHCVQGYAPSLRDAPLRVAPSIFFNLAGTTILKSETDIATPSPADLRPACRLN